jgi:hypothetical protein
MLDLVARQIRTLPARKSRERITQPLPGSGSDHRDKSTEPTNWSVDYRLLSDEGAIVVLRR